MIKITFNKIRYNLGNLIGLILFSLNGKRVLLNELDENRILSIYFHNPSVKLFETIIKWLKKNEFDIISINTFQEYLKSNSCKNKRTVFISFDDAWSGNLKLIPVLKKYNIPITLFVATDAINDGQLWLNMVREKFNEIDYAKRKDVKVKDIKKIPYQKARELYSQVKSLGNIKREIMTKEELINFSKMASIGSHTLSHPILVNCEDAIIMEELLGSETILKNWGLNINKSFAYPNGSYNTNVVSLIKNTNYCFAFTTEPKIIDLKEKQNNYTIPRICVPDGFSKYENLARMSTVWSKIFKG